MRSERGLALVISLLMMLVLVLVGTALSISSRGGINVSTSFRNQQTAYEVALAGLEHGREAVRARQFVYAQGPSPTPAPTDGDRFTNLLTLAADGGALTDSVDLSNFNVGGATTNGFTGTPDKPVLAHDGTPIVAGGIVAVGGASYRTFVTNDAADTGGAIAIADTNRTITLTAFGSDSNSRGYSVVQGVYRPREVPDIPMDPGLVMPGPTVDFDSPPSNAADFSGDGDNPCYPAIAVTTNAAAADLIDYSDGDGMRRPANYTTCRELRDRDGDKRLPGTIRVTRIPHSRNGAKYPARELQASRAAHFGD